MRTCLCLLLLAGHGAVGAAVYSGSGLRPAELRCEYRVDPVGLDVTQPRLSWVVESGRRGQRQTAYQVLVASSIEAVAARRGDLWDSGKVVSDQTIHLTEAGKALAMADGVRFLRVEGDRVLVAVESGRYDFTVRTRNP